MTLVDNWQSVLKSAWSMRLNWFAIGFGSMEVGLPFFTDVIPQHAMGALSVLSVVGAQVTRLMAQPAIHAVADKEEPFDDKFPQ